MSNVSGNERVAQPSRASASPESTRYRVAFVNTHPIQYFAPLYAHLTRYSDLDVTALYLSDFSLRGGHDRGFDRSVTWDIGLLDGYTAEFVGAASRRRIGGFFSMIAPELWRAIRKGRFDALVINGHNLAAHHVALAAGRFAGTPTFSRCETHLRLKRSAWRQAVRTPLIRAWYKAFDGFLAIGSANARYYSTMGVPEHRIFLMPYAVDNDRFMTRAKQSDRAATRARLGLRSDYPAILFAGKFERRKHPDDLLIAYEKLRQQGVSAQLLMVGSGALEHELRDIVRDRNIPNVTFPGFINQTDLPSVYAASEVFVLPSENEPWGLVVNEAMCAGLPIVLSEEIGCAEDLVTPGLNGATFRARDVGALVKVLEPILLDRDYRAKCSSASIKRIKSWGYRECGHALRAAIQNAKARRIQRAVGYGPVSAGN
jgi:glycosyltransferase involved in cell wall biosynthesis